jgi:translation initiation factor IF-2
MPIRVYDLAKEVGLSNKEVIEKLKAMKLEVKSQSSSIPNIYADELRKQLGVTLPAPAPKGAKSPVKDSHPAAATQSPTQPVVAVAPPPKATSTEPKMSAIAPTVSEPTKKTEPPISTPTIPPPGSLPRSSPVGRTAPPTSPTIKVAQPTAPTVTLPPAKLAPARPAPPPPKIAAPPSAPQPVVVVKQGDTLKMKPPVVVKDLAARLGLKPFQLIQELIEVNVFATQNQTLDEVAAKKVCARHGVHFELEKRDHTQIARAVVEKAPVAEKKVESAADLQLRPPVVTFMGHVDHGKTSLLDAIRKANIAAKEAGGITQHIGAYTVEIPHPEQQNQKMRITFLDTPGHAAFTQMRARGANLTDIVVLVVAADDGVMPQTIEALNHARAAKVPIIVAINKMDLPNANPERVKRQLQEHDLTPEEWGGQTIVCEVSATKREGINHLLEMILLQADILELKANPDRPAEGNVIESQMEPAGPTATVLVRKGTLKVGDAAVCEKFHGKIKALTDHLGKRVKQATPSEAVKILGLNGLPAPGAPFVVVPSLAAAREQAEQLAQQQAIVAKTPPKRVSLEDLFSQLSGTDKKELRLIIKADVQGSLEAITEALRKIKSDKVTLTILHAAVGPVTESDVQLAAASDAVVIGFHVKLENNVSDIAKHEGVQIKLYSIIYELLDQVELAMEGLLEPEVKETILGHAEVKQIFEVSKGRVAGCLVKDGRVLRNARVRVMRRGQVQVETRFSSLKRFQDDVSEVRAGQECGVRLENFADYQVGDILECYQIEKVAQKL